MAGDSFRIFVSSPSDVAAERGRVKLVADRLNAQFEGRVRLEVLRWEDAFYSAAQSLRALGLAHHRAGLLLTELKRTAEAVDRFRANLAVTEQYAKLAADNVQYQIELIASLFQLALAGDDSRARLERARAVATKLDADGRMPANQKFWIEAIEEGLASLPK